MTKEEFIAEIESQKERGVKLLGQVQQMHVGKNNYGDGTAVFGIPRLYYSPKEELEPVAAEYESWKCYVKDFLLSVLEKDDAFVLEWDSCLQTPYRHDVSERDWYSKEINKALAKLDSFVQRIGFRFKESAMKQETAEHEKNDSKKLPKVFISHKKEDQEYADALVNMINFIIGPDGDKVFCSSVPGYGIKQSRSILGKLKAEFDNYDVFMLIVHSPRYYKSAICLNEMGASWVLGTQFSSFMTNDCKPEHLCGVINRDYICIDLNDDPEMLESHLNDFKNDLLTFFNAPQIDENKWAHERKRFIKAVMSLDYENTDETQDTSSDLTEEQLDILRQWVESGNNIGFVCGYIGGKLFILGDNQYEVNEGREEAQWNAFIEKLEEEDYIAFKEFNKQGNPVYELKIRAYNLFEK